MAVLRLVENGGGRVSHNNRGWESRFYGQQLIIAPLGESKRGPTDSPQYSTLHRAPTSVSRIHDKRAAASPFPVRCTHRLACAASIPIARKPPAVALAVGQHPFEERTCCGTWDRPRAARRLEQIWVADWLFAGVNPPIDFY